MRKAAWVIPSFIEGSGGYRTVFQHVNIMSTEFECDVYVYDSGDYRSDKELEQNATRLYGECNCRFHLGYDISLEIPYDLIIATAWMTAEIVYRYKGPAKKVYFVQDYEPMFYPVGNQYLRAAGTYELGFYHITIGRWLAKKLKEEHCAKAAYFDFCADKKIYFSNKNQNREKAICFIYQPDKPRRGAEIGLEALALVKRIRPDVTVYLYGSKEKFKIPFEHSNLGLVSLQQCAELYNKCSVGLCISATNPSRIPFEMMACGLPVVDVFSNNNLYDFAENTITLAQCRPESLAQAVINLLDNQESSRKISEQEQMFMSDRDINVGLGQFMKCIQGVLEGQDELFQKEEPAFTYQGEPIIAGEEVQELRNEIAATENNDWYSKIKRITWIRRIPGVKRIKKVLRVE